MNLRAAVFSVCLLLSACSTHGATGQKYAARQNKIFITSQALPAGVTFDPIKPVHARKIWYGSSQTVLVSIADQARKLGANAIIEERTWYAPGGFSLASPHCSGQAVRISDATSLERLDVKGDWY